MELCLIKNIYNKLLWDIRDVYQAVNIIMRTSQISRCLNFLALEIKTNWIHNILESLTKLLNPQEFV